MKIKNRLYLVDNLSLKDYDKLDCAVIIATCLTSAKIYAKERWPEVGVEIKELNQEYIDRLARSENILICEKTIDD